MDLKEIKKIIKNNLAFIKEKYGVKEVGIFGSFATGEQKKGSDVDVLVEFNRSITLLKYANLKNFLEDQLNIKVDLVQKSGLKPLIKDSILKETIYL
ncbi:nucleotidyltransferase family protein [Patescibacteria group bacterium]|nr:nucleotidyltransferase family protein [Candidatus Falkowbacteria bacterium]MBU3905805.1 nucleotidyltransferase family protein [Patescibacteria group bacterium]MBU4015400.1 nucleotidyltransferase family protein [Patescibacteria group bacterium]MBU4026000.1 nucleotidyltransferase family protein [Patescibacteria group bacterium]MBU4072902.1 nucleotidyltransferase family protein [Patescibacteria group bacterium]